MYIENLQTGDLLLFTSNTTGFLSYFSSLIKWGSHSNYTHIAMVLKDPDFINPPLKGLYVWQSGWESKPDPQDEKIKFGVQITPLKEIIEDYNKTGHVFVRKLVTLNDKDCFNNSKLKKIHKDVYHKPYDLVITDWIKAFIQKNNNPQRTDRFWCSALVGYIYTKCGILKQKTDWTILRPCDFALSSENLKYAHNYILDNIETRII
jgi:hypothetical protein